MESKEVVRRFMGEVMNGENLDAVDDIASPDHVNHDPTAPEGIKRPAGMYRCAFPDLRFETGEMICEGDTVAHRRTLTGTHGGEVAGVEMNRVESGWISPRADRPRS